MLDNNQEEVGESNNNEIHDAASSASEFKEEVQEVSSSPENDEVSDAVNEIEEKVAEQAEEVKEVSVKKEVDYTTLALEDLVAALETVLKENPPNRVKTQVDAIKNAFNQKFGAVLAEKKAAFIEAGGDSIDFQFSSPVKTAYNSLLSQHKKERDVYYREQEQTLKLNLEKRFEVIEALKNLIADADTNTMYKQFKEIQDSWRAIGPVSKTKYNDTWKTYHHHVERFYDLLHLSNDFRDLDFKNNLEEKLKIIEKAEALVEKEDINTSFKELQDLHKIWKEDIGPVARELREEIWGKFSDVTKKIHDKRHEHFRSMKSKYDEIIQEKLAIVSQIFALDTSKNKNHNDWQQSINEVDKLRQAYFNAGKLPYSKSEEIWQQFKLATKKFNKDKNNFYKREKVSQQENLNKKNALIELAESLKDSTDWETSTEIFKKLQADWKEIGHVPRKFSDDVWKRFKSACNHYFDQYHKSKNAISPEDQVIIDAKKALLEKIKTIEIFSKEDVLDAIQEWKNIGHLPRSVRHLEGKFNKQIDRLISTLSIDKNEIEMLRFKNNIDGFEANNDTRKLDSELIFVRKKVDEIVKEVQQLENNLGFFSNAKDDNPLVLNVKARVEEFKKDLALWKEKLNYIKNIDY
ncbi:DUF349 domain-containing protein [Polaribacter sp. HL-MS24]|uniref:DUF349 domain-containing protein n=1 Tax=Polaribacter sp. HL-MS24 TaxID=3077735 RepID=UPI002934F5D7|nr:DUF349 domain-containing protein [Polaribacter sp. HL-MS24]WOC39705.1 DUF349 domain-containing protein [Polaribacter sp. HL-MS24]